MGPFGNLLKKGVQGVKNLFGGQDSSTNPIKQTQFNPQNQSTMTGNSALVSSVPKQSSQGGPQYTPAPVISSKTNNLQVNTPGVSSGMAPGGKNEIFMPSDAGKINAYYKDNNLPIDYGKGPSLDYYNSIDKPRHISLDERKNIFIKQYNDTRSNITAHPQTLSQANQVPPSKAFTPANQNQFQQQQDKYSQNIQEITQGQQNLAELQKDISQKRSQASADMQAQADADMGYDPETNTFTSPTATPEAKIQQNLAAETFNRAEQKANQRKTEQEQALASQKELQDHQYQMAKQQTQQRLDNANRNIKNVAANLNLMAGRMGGFAGVSSDAVRGMTNTMMDAQQRIDEALMSQQDQKFMDDYRAKEYNRQNQAIANEYSEKMESVTDGLMKDFRAADLEVAGLIGKMKANGALLTAKGAAEAKDLLAKQAKYRFDRLTQMSDTLATTANSYNTMLNAMREERKYFNERQEKGSKIDETLSQQTGVVTNVYGQQMYDERTGQPIKYTPDIQNIIQDKDTGNVAIVKKDGTTEIKKVFAGDIETQKIKDEQAFVSKYGDFSGTPIQRRQAVQTLAEQIAKDAGNAISLIPGGSATIMNEIEKALQSGVPPTQAASQAITNLYKNSPAIGKFIENQLFKGSREEKALDQMYDIQKLREQGNIQSQRDEAQFGRDVKLQQMKQQFETEKQQSEWQQTDRREFRKELADKEKMTEQAIVKMIQDNPGISREQAELAVKGTQTTALPEERLAYAFSIPDGTKMPGDGGKYHCGMFVNDVIGQPGFFGDSLASKKARINWDPKKQGAPPVGSAIIMNTGTQYGHVGLVAGIDENGNYIIKDSNFKNDGIIRTHVVPKDSPQVVGFYAKNKPKIFENQLQAGFQKADGTIVDTKTGKSFAADQLIKPIEQKKEKDSTYTPEMNRVFNDAQQLNPIIMKIPEIRSSESQAMASLDSANGVGDIAAVFQFMKTLDPKSVVREGEFDKVLQANGLNAQKFEQMTTGQIAGTSLTPKLRNDIKNFVKKLTNIKESEYEAARKSTEMLLRATGASDTVINGLLKPVRADYEKTLPQKSRIQSRRESLRGTK